jgi:ATP-binding cassette subfamily F protein 3
MLQAQEVTLQRGTKILLEKATLTIYANEKVGIIGANGAGKSSLFKLFLHEIQADHGDVLVPQTLSYAHIRQEMPDSQTAALDYVLEGDQDYHTVIVALKQAEDEHDGVEQAKLHDKLLAINGYAMPAYASKILLGLGFSQEELQHPVKAFSGGWRMRLNLAQVLISRADVLLLDEPTNHLDLEAIFWLSSWLQQIKKTTLIISHDRDFLDEVVSHIVLLKHQQLKKYTGTYSTYEKQYALELELQQKSFVKQQKERDHIQKFVSRFKAKASKAKQVQSRVKMLGRMENIAAVQAESGFRFQFDQSASGGNPMLSASDTVIGYGDAAILSRLNFSLSDGDRIGLIGPNGAGKSTFVKFLAEEIQAMRGDDVRGVNMKVGYFAQHQLEQLTPENSALAHLQKLDKRIPESEARRYLGGFNFIGDKVFDPVKLFSGGEKARLVLALIIWQKPNLLLLDEPTNHLDLDMREALVLALQEYQGALVLVSHDRFMLSSVVDEFWLVANGGLTKFDGDLDDYREWFDQQRLEQASVVQKKKSSNKGKPKSLKAIAQHEKKIAKLERVVAAHHETLAGIHERLADSDIYQSEHVDELKQLTAMDAEVKGLISENEEEILVLMQLLEGD